MRSMFACALALLILGACVTTDDKPHPIIVDQRVNAVIDNYLNGRHRPVLLAFEVLPDGRVINANSFVCPDVQCQMATDNAVLHRCRQQSSGGECRVYMRDNRVVWNGPIIDSATGTARP